MTARLAPAAVALATAALLARAAAAQTPQQIVDRAAAAYAQMRTARVTFTQTVSNPLTNRDVASAGVMIQQIPGRYRVTFTQPKGDRIISDGKTVWVYLPSTNPGQVMKLPVREGGNGVPDFTAYLLNAPKERFSLADGGATTVNGHNAHTVLLTPKVGGIPFTKARIWVDDTNGLVRQFETTDVNGGMRRVRIESIDMNVPVEAALFTFTPPSGVKVVDASGVGT